MTEAAQDKASHAAASLQESSAQAAGAARDKGHEAAEVVRSSTQVPCFCRALYSRGWWFKHKSVSVSIHKCGVGTVNGVTVCVDMNMGSELRLHFVVLQTEKNKQCIMLCMHFAKLQACA